MGQFECSDTLEKSDISRGCQGLPHRGDPSKLGLVAIGLHWIAGSGNMALEKAGVVGGGLGPRGPGPLVCRAAGGSAARSPGLAFQRPILWMDGISFSHHLSRAKYSCVKSGPINLLSRTLSRCFRDPMFCFRGLWFL